jgi:hypothetical protein
VANVENVWIAELFISEPTAQKLTNRHHLHPQEVREAVLCVSGLRGSWDIHPERGERALVRTFIRGKEVLVVLYPRGPHPSDEWNLGSAYFLP